MEKIKAIVAIDDVKGRLPLVTALDRKGYYVIAVEDGARAWEEIIALRSPAVVILQEELPITSGNEICRNLKEVDFKRHVHLVVLSRNPMPEKVVSFLEEGADDCLAADVPIPEIMAHLKIARKRLLAIKHLEDQIYDLAHTLQGRYQMLKPIGRGGLGEVYEGWDTALRRQVAIKKFHARLGLEAASDDDMWREAKITAALNHPNVVTIHDCWTTPAGAFVVMEFLQGVTLDEYLMGRLLSYEMFFKVASQVLSGLNAAHLAGVYHCDLKPSNLMLTGEIWSEVPDLHLKILDFGVARLAEDAHASQFGTSATIDGSLYFIAPEILENERVDGRSDLYSLGHILYWGLSGVHAMQGKNPDEILQKHIDGIFEPIHKLRPDMPVELCNWVEKLMQRNVGNRPQSSKEALDELNGIHWKKPV